MLAPVTKEDKPVDRLERMVWEARANEKDGYLGSAQVLYRLILRDTEQLRNGRERIAHGEAARWFAREALAKGKFGSGADYYYQAIQADPLAVDYRIEVIRFCLIPMGLHKEAMLEANKCIKIEPKYSHAWRIYGQLCHITGDVPECIRAYDKQIELLPNDCSYLDRVTIALDTADYTTVRKLCGLIGPECEADKIHALAMTAYREGKHEEAIELYQKAIDLKCQDVELARWNMSLAQHSIGRYKEGWQNHEARGRQKTDRNMARVMTRFQAPIFNNEPAPARIHVHQEMGFGDAIAMARYLPLLVARGYDVSLEVNDSLVDVFKHSLEGVTVLPKSVDYPSGLGLPQFDYHIPMLSLPAIFGTEIDTIPWAGPYIKYDAYLARLFHEALGNAPGKRVGLCWSSGVRDTGVWMSQYGRRKSMHFDALYSHVHALQEHHVRALDPMMFVSLQVGPEREQNSTLGSSSWRVLDLLPKIPTWSDTAALIANLDLVITVDTSVAHLAGAMGKPTWVMMHTEGSWHFMAPRPGAVWNERSPWYPSVRVFRQDEPHEWGNVIQRIAQELRQ